MKILNIFDKWKKNKEENENKTDNKVQSVGGDGALPKNNEKAKSSKVGENEKEGQESEIISKKDYRNYITDKEFQQKIQDLEAQKKLAKTDKEKETIEEKINFLNRLRGKR